MAVGFCLLNICMWQGRYDDAQLATGLQRTPSTYWGSFLGALVLLTHRLRLLTCPAHQGYNPVHSANNASCTDQWLMWRGSRASPHAFYGGAGNSPGALSCTFCLCT